MDIDFKVRTGEFEGPIDLLLTMIEKKKLHINTISISEVADDFLKFIQTLETFPIKDSSEFILIASTLLLIKSKSLLPNLDLTKEEEENIAELENRIKEYERYKNLTKEIQKMIGAPIYFAEEPKNKMILFVPTEEISRGALHNSIISVFQNLPKEPVLPKVVVEKTIRLEEVIDNLSKRLEEGLKTTFSQISGAKTNLNKAEKINVIINFLALLELVKRGSTRAEQKENFEDIEIEGENIMTPIYN